MKSSVLFIVDKNQVHRSLLKYHLNVNKFNNVHVFQSGSECLYRIRKNLVPDFLIADLDIGDITGPELMEKVRELAPTVRFIFFASQDNPLFALKLLESGATDYIVKTKKIDLGINELVRNIDYLVRVEASEEIADVL
jgi:DNA-binding response OmpR family regulator